MKRIIAIVFAAVIPLLAGAQALKGSYFLDSSLNRHEMNPAFAPRADYFQLFGIGNLGVGAMTNLDVPTFLYPRNGELLTFLHKDVSVAQFDRALPKHPHLDVDFNTTLFGFGFYTKKLAYWTFDLDVRTTADVDMPRDLFMFFKKGTGTSAQSFNVGNMNGYMTAGLQASLGYSRNIIKGLRAGVKARFIAPLAYAGINLENVRLNTSPEKWSIVTEGYLHTAVHGMDVSIPQEETMPSVTYDMNRMLANKVLAGMGVSFDFGVEYTLERGTLFDGLSVSAAVTDLGWIKYNRNAVTSLKLSGSFDWEGFTDVSLDNTDFAASMDNMLAGMKEGLLNMEGMEQAAGFRRSTMPRLYIGAEMPFLKRSMSVGLLYSSRFSHSYARHELTVSYNLTPCKWFAMGLNYSFLNTARTMGFIFELTPKWGPAFYIGGDYLPLSWAKAPAFVSDASGVNIIPLSYRLNLNFGIAFHVGSKYLRNPKKVKNTNKK